MKVQGKYLVRYSYTEHGSKNRSGGLKQLHQDNKVVHQYESDDVEHYHVLLLDKYISKLPPDAEKKDLFYCKPMSPWYTALPVGKNKLSELMKTMAARAGLQKPLTNHGIQHYLWAKISFQN